jgi:protein-S-isoprenylcysteine O-methyltransferase Ste14
MNILQPWNLVFFAGFVPYFWIRHVSITRTRGEKKVASRFGGLEKVLLFAMSISVLLLPLLYWFTPLLNFANYHLPVLVPSFGTAIMVLSLWLFWRSHSDLGQNWSVTLELRENHQLVTHGVYRFIRHPMYASIWLWAIAQAMMLQNWLAGWPTLIAFAFMYFLRVSREERMMAELFGDDYRRYMEQTGRLFPRLKINT